MCSEIQAARDYCLQQISELEQLTSVNVSHVLLVDMGVKNLCVMNLTADDDRLLCNREIQLFRGL